MSPVGGILFLSAVAAGILLSGYWLNSLQLVDTFAERLALAALAGLATLLLMAIAVNFFRPLSGVWAGLCLLPAAGTVLWPRTRNQLLADGRSLVHSRSGLMVLALAAVFLVLLLGPALRDGQALFYDGTTNHDSFIWITSGEFLQHHSYMETPEFSATQPWMNMANDNIGWHPRRAQLGAETLLALCSGLAFTTPLNTCLYFAAALFLPWCAAVYLAVTTFFRARISRGSLAALVLLQPIFVFFYANSNLPNLLGAMMGAAVVIATEQALRAGTRRRCLGWCVLLGLGFHGQIAAYPEMIPFILLPCGLLWLRPWFARRWEVVRSCGVWVAAAFLAGSVINPPVTVRAWHGFWYSFATARTDVIFANLLEPLNAAEHVPGLATLSIPAALSLGDLRGAVLTLLLLAAATAGWWRARDRLGALCTLAGSGTLLIYTLVTGFNYGLQKSVQFGAVFVVAILTAPLFDAQFDQWRKSGWRRLSVATCLGCIIVYYATATALNFQQIQDWSRQKMLSRDWFELRELSATTLREQPVLVESASFVLPFFHSMWSSYFLSSSRTYFTRRGGEGGGYLRLGVLDESSVPDSRPAALLVGRRWAETFDANSTRLRAGREYALLQEANRVVKMEGAYPLNGVPEYASTGVSLEILPHSPARLRITLVPRLTQNWPVASWRLSHRVGTGPEEILTVSGAPPWQFDVPLVAHQDNQIEFTTEAPKGNTEILPFAFNELKIESAP